MIVPCACKKPPQWWIAFNVEEEVSRVPYGIVKWFDEHKGYGIVTTEDGKVVFVHFSAINSEGPKSLKTGDRVAFDVVPGPATLQALNMTKL